MDRSLRSVFVKAAIALTVGTACWALKGPEVGLGYGAGIFIGSVMLGGDLESTYRLMQRKINSVLRPRPTV
jgi:hypothetical protein